jgi:leader peptidase (prepilin peptidase) / N-methyltransferase
VIELLAGSALLTAGAAFLIGLLFGSFLNVVIYRVPIMMDNELRAECAELACTESQQSAPPAPPAAPVAPVALESEAATAAEPGPVVETATEAGPASMPLASMDPAVIQDADAMQSAAPVDGTATPEPESAPATSEPAGPPVFNLIVPRSACPACKTPIKPQENIPIVSWFMLGGKCSSCGAPISKRYPLIELTTGVLSGLVAWHFGFGTTALAVIAFTWFLIALTMIDYDTQFLPDQLTYPLLWLGLLVSLSHPVWSPGAEPLTPRDSIIGAATGYLTLWSVYWMFKWLTGKEGMGYGDFKLFAALGAWLGWQMLLPVLVFASGLGAIVGIVAMIRHRKGRDTQIPFGPFLSVAGWLALMLGHRVVDLFLNNNFLG